jgi:hypothetical protein
MAMWQPARRKIAPMQRSAMCQYFEIFLRTAFARPSITREIWLNILWNRKPYLAIFADKLESKVLIEQLGLRVPQTLQVFSDFEEHTLKSIPRNCVIKPNHASGMVLVVSESIPRLPQPLAVSNESPFGIKRVHPDDLSLDWLMAKFQSWLSVDFYNHRGKIPEYAYKNIPRKVFAEQLLGDGLVSPVDIRFFCIRGRLKFVNLNFGRETGTVQTALLDRNNRSISGHYGNPHTFPSHAGPLPQAAFDRMKVAAELISKKTRLLRIDFYLLDDEIFVGELTNYPNAGLGSFQPESLDRDLYLA